MPVDFKDYYRVLGVERTANASEIKRAFRERARKLHPDVNRDDPHAEDRFKEINEAYEVLSDTEKRARYDRFGTDWQRYQSAGDPGPSPTASAHTRTRTRSQQSPPPAPEDFEEWFTGGTYAADSGWDRSESSSGNSRFSDFFTMLFGTGRQSSSSPGARQSSVRPRRGDDTEVEVNITLREAADGTKRHVALQMPVTCPRCKGTGLARGAMCPTCEGTGMTLTSKTLEVTIPKGVRTGSRVRMGGQGAPGEGGGPNGDVYLKITVSPDPQFERQGNDLRQRVMVPVTTAVLGGEVVVPTLGGRVAMTIPEGAQDGATFRLRGKGMPSLGGKNQPNGDILVEIHVSVPTKLSDKERALFKQLRDLRE